MATTPNLGITLLEQSQAQKELTVNEALSVLDSVIGGGVIDKNLSAPPGSPSVGDRYIVGASATDAWAGKENHIAFYFNGGWRFINPGEGLFTWVNDEDLLYVFTGSAWTSSVGGTLAASMLGINATADTTNRLAVATDAVLFNRAADDIQVKLNKQASGDVASFLFQTGFSGRAEFGTIGDDNFTLKSSGDGTTWLDVLKMIGATGRIAVKSIATGIVAAGANQADATVLAKTLNAVAIVASGEGVRLPAPEPGEVVLVANQGANNLKIYPASGGTINALAADAPLTLATDTRRLFYALSTTQWYSL